MANDTVFHALANFFYFEIITESLLKMQCHLRMTVYFQINIIY